MYSDDFGESWVQAESVPYTSTLTDISCSSKKSCWVTGHDATILHSNDYGQTWIKQYEDLTWDAPLLSIHMLDDKEEMFNAPRYVIKAGMLLIENHEFVSDYTDKKVLRVAPDFDESIEDVIKPFFDDFYSISFRNYKIDDDYLHGQGLVIDTHKKNSIYEN